MSRDMTLIVLGLLTIVIPYTGFPSSWRTLLLVLIGLAVAVIGFLMRGQTLSKPKKTTEQHSSFQESVRPAQEPIQPQQELVRPMSDIRPLE
jgi:hypothetical protein